MTIQEMRQAAGEAVVRAQAIRNLVKAENRQATDDENTRFDSAMADSDRFLADADREERVAAASAKLGTTQNNPLVQGVRDLAAEKPWGSMGEFFGAIRSAGTPGNAVDPRLLATRAASGLNVTAAPDEGGYLVVSDYSTELLKLVHNTGVMVADCDTKGMSGNSNSMVLFGIDETSRVNGSRYGGVQSYWANEADTVTASKPKFRRMQLHLNKLFALAYATDEMLADSAVLGDVIREAFSGEMGFKLDDAIVRGNGAGQPLGILNSPALISQAAEAAQTASTFNYNNALKMANRMYVAGRKRAKWYINIDLIPQIQKMYLDTGTANGVALIQPYQISPEGVETLFGRPIVPVEQCSALGTIGDVIYADLSQFQLIDKGGLQSAESMHVRFIYGENTFRFTYRVDGQPKWNSALTPYKGSTTVSPFVALAAR